MIQVIDKQYNTFRIVIDGKLYYFVPPTYLTNKFIPINPIAKGSTLGWNLKGRFISYNQIKKAIKSP